MKQGWQSLSDGMRNREGVREMLAAQDFDYMVTVTLNNRWLFSQNRSGSHSIDYARRTLKYWHARIDRQLLGQRWAKKPVEQRSFFVAIPEKIKTNLHYHMLYRLPPKGKAEVFEDWADAHWQKLMPHGDALVRKIENFEGAWAANLYGTKDLWKKAVQENFVISREFSSLPVTLES